MHAPHARTGLRVQELDHACHQSPLPAGPVAARNNSTAFRSTQPFITIGKFGLSWRD